MGLVLSEWIAVDWPPSLAHFDANPEPSIEIQNARRTFVWSTIITFGKARPRGGILFATCFPKEVAKLFRDPVRNVHF